MYQVRGMLGWRAYYTNNRIYDSARNTWAELPAEGVLLVVEFRVTGRTIYSGGDWYWLYDGTFGYRKAAPWGDHAPKPDHIACLSCIKRGVGVPDDEFHAVYNTAWTDTWLGT